MKTKTIYWIIAITISLLAIALYFNSEIKAMFSKEKASSEIDLDGEDDEPLPDPPEAYQELTPLEYGMINYNSALARQKVKMWVEMFKLCPFWTAFVTDTYNRYKGNKQNQGITLEDRFYVVAQEMIDGNADILEKYGRCDLKYTRDKGNAEYNSIGLKSM